MHTSQPSAQLPPPAPARVDAESLRVRLEPLLARYDAAVPRYTSYPPIPYWGELEPETVERWLTGPEDAARAEAAPDSLALYTHVPFCRSRCTYCGCHVVITPHQAPAERYVDHVRREMERVAALLGTRRTVRQYHLGGGTPNFLAPRTLERLVATARACFAFAPDAELSIEADPRHLGPGALEHLRTLGFNRLSLGIQDFDPLVQSAVNRRQSYAPVLQLMADARKLGFLSVNLDLIYGLPQQTRARFARTLHRVLALRPERVALYHFAHLPQAFPHQRRLDATALPDAREKLTLFLDAREQLLEAGFEAIGLDHFARADDALALARRAGTLRRNFMGYTTHAGTDLIGFGVSAISECGGRYWQNEKKLVAYERTVAAGRIPAVRGMALDTEDRLRQAVVADLFCQGALDYAALSARFGLDVRAHLAPELDALAPLEADGLVLRGAERLAVTELGRFLLRNVAVIFDPRTRRGSPVQFSRSV